MAALPTAPLPLVSLPVVTPVPVRQIRFREDLVGDRP